MNQKAAASMLWRPQVSRPVVLVDRGLDALEPVGDLHAGLLLHGHLAGLAPDDHVVLEEGGGILRDRLQRFGERGEGGAVHRVRVAHGHDVLVRLVHRGVQHEARAVDRIAALDDLARVVGQDQVGHLHLVEVDRHRVGPVQLRELGVADRQVAGEAVVEAFQREGAAGGDQALLAVLALCGEGGEHRLVREDQGFLLGLVDGGRAAVGGSGGPGGEAVQGFDHGVSPRVV